LSKDAPTVIDDANQYERAKDELRHLENWLDRLQREHPGPAKGLTKAGVRMMIARLHEELAIYEGSRKVHRHDHSQVVPDPQ
jgi:hypothetical protein